MLEGVGGAGLTRKDDDGDDFDCDCDDGGNLLALDGVSAVASADN